MFYILGGLQARDSALGVVTLASEKCGVSAHDGLAHIQVTVFQKTFILFQIISRKFDTPFSHLRIDVIIFSLRGETR